MESGLTTHQLSEELDQQRGSRHSDDQVRMLQSIANSHSYPHSLLHRDQIVLAWSCSKLSLGMPPSSSRTAILPKTLGPFDAPSPPI